MMCFSESTYLYMICSICVYIGIYKLWHRLLQVDLTEYVERHEFLYDAVLNENVSNEKVSTYIQDRCSSPILYVSLMVILTTKPLSLLI